MKIGPASAWVNAGGKLCECPLWEPGAQKLYWTDITAGHLYSCGGANPPAGNAAGLPLLPAAPVFQRIYEGPLVGGFTLQADGSLLLFRERDIAAFTPGGATRAVADFRHEGSTRFNDVIAAPEGRAFAGTIGKTSGSGGLFRIDRDASIIQVASGTGCSNGLAFSPALDLLYWVCSTRRRIFEFPYNPSTGSLGEPRTFFQGDESDGYPDGLTTDSQGNLYSIRWAAAEYGLVVFSPEGKVLHQQKLPPRASTSLCFCGPNLTDVAITSAELSEDPDREADLYLIRDMPIAGRVELRSSIGI